MAERNRREAPGMMRRANPMKLEGVREKVSLALRRIGHAPRVRGGNGTGPTVAQQSLARALGMTMEFTIKTMMGRPYPPCYKVDLADESMMLAIEVDGGSHCSLIRRAQDRKKEAALCSLGWTVLRFSNAAVMDRLEECVRAVSSITSR
jgi:very-short-patch-repair endonuclease